MQKKHQHLEKIKQECDKKTDDACGDNCKWIFDEKTKALFIREKGKTKDYTQIVNASWSSKKENSERCDKQWNCNN